MDDITRAVEIARSLGIDADRAEALPGGTETRVVRVRSSRDDIAVRLARDPERSDDPFDVEAWCLQAAARAGLRTSRLLARGWSRGRSYLVASYVPGIPADADDLRGWTAIGEFTRALRALSTHDAPDAAFTRFGRDLDRAWARHLAYNLDALGPDDPLIPLGIYPRSQQRELRDLTASLAARTLPQGLVHGDTAHRNLLRHDDVYTVIDWGAAMTGPVMWGDLARIFRWHRLEDAQSPVSSAAWSHALDGAGLTRAEAEPVVRELTVVHALDLVRWALARRPDRLAEIAEDSRRALATMVLAQRPGSR
jgi:aminoglycoside phosphotransferase